MAKRVLSLRCPTCRKVVLRTDPEFPFCSERCRLIDLGKWASGGYVISTPVNQADASGEADYATDQRRRRGSSAPQPHGKADDDKRQRR